MEEENLAFSHKIVTLLSNPRRLIFTILAGNTLVNTAATACATSVAISLFGKKGVGIAIAFMLFVLLLFGELIPKTYAFLSAEKVARFSAYPLLVMVKLFTPIRAILYRITTTMIKRLGFMVPKDSTEITEAEIKSLIKIGHREGIVEDEEKELIYGVFDFKGQCAKDIMTPKPDVMALDFDIEHEQILRLTKEAKYSRLPVYRDTLDNIVGVVYAKDILFDPSKNLKDLIRESFFVPESKKIDSLLGDLQKRAIQMAIVTDEYGVTTGIVTMEDILEEIVGEIVDEHDKEELDIVKIDDKTYKISGFLHINEANEKFNLKIKTEEVDTMGGFVAMVMQRIPKENEEFVYGKYKFTISKTVKNRVKEIIITRL